MTSVTLHSPSDRLGLMLFLAAGFHLLVILGVSFELEERKKNEARQQSLEVMVIQKPVELPEADEKADYLAQTSQTGGGEQDEPARPTTRAIATPAQQAAPQPSLNQSPQPPPRPAAPPPKPVITQAASPHKIAAAKTRPAIESPPQPTSAQLFASRDQEIAHLTAELERRTLAYAKMPKRKAISASTKEYKYAAYLDAWRRKVERIGNLNYPDEAKRQKLYGNLILHVAIKQDGSIEQVRVLHSSGHKMLDDAALRIVRLAGPYSPFPQEIREETDILDITRTWQFLRDNRLDSR